MRAFLLLFLSVAPARADVLLRMAAIAPDGSAWTRELKAFAREIESRTKGHVRMRWYWGGIAGDELQVLERIRREQLDGQAGAQMCDRVAPSLRVMRMLGLFQTWDEAAYVIARMRGGLDKEFHAHGFAGFVGSMGLDILFTGKPVRDLASLRRQRIWLWTLDEVLIDQLKSIGIPTITTDVGDAMKAFDEGRFDGWIAIPAGALAYQWSARMRYFTDLRFAFLPGCVIIGNRAFDGLSVEEQHTIREAAAKLLARFEEMGRTQERRLLSGLFEKQGLRPLAASAMFRAELFAAAEEARQHVPASLVAPSLVQKVGGWLADYRAQHR